MSAPEAPEAEGADADEGAAHRGSAIAFIDYLRAGALLGMIVYHARVLQLMPEDESAPFRVSRVMDLIGALSRNTFVFLIGLSMVLSTDSAVKRGKGVRAAQRSDDFAMEAAVLFALKKLARAGQVGAGAMIMTLASRIFMGERRTIRWGVLHYAASVIAVGGLIGSVFVWYELSQGEGEAREDHFPGVGLAAALSAGLLHAAKDSGAKKALEPRFVPNRTRVGLWDLALGSRIGAADVYAIDYFSTRAWVLLTAAGASAGVAFRRIMNRWRGRTVLGGAPDRAVRRLARMGLELYVTHFVAFLAAYRACSAAP